MFLGEVTISEKAIKENALKTIYKELEDYLEDGVYFLELVLEDRENKETILERNLLFKKEIYMGDKLELYIETYKNDGGTVVLEGKEYLEREINNFAYALNFKENSFLKSILNEFQEEGTPFEQKTSTRILRKLANLEIQKKYLKEKDQE